MTYKLTRDDLKTLGNGIRNANSMSVEEHLDAFLADKPTTDWQVIASGEVKGRYDGYVGDKSIYNIENKILAYQGKNIEIAIRVKQNS